MSKIINNTSTAKKPKLLDLVRDVFRTNHYSKRPNILMLIGLRNSFYFTTKNILKKWAKMRFWYKNENHIPKNKIVHLKIEYGEIDSAMKVKSFGGKWNKAKKV